MKNKRNSIMNNENKFITIDTKIDKPKGFENRSSSI